MGRVRSFRSKPPDYRKLIGEALLVWHGFGAAEPEPDGPGFTLLSEDEDQRLRSPRDSTSYEALKHLVAYYHQIEDALEPVEFFDSPGLPHLDRAVSRLRNTLWKRVQRVLVLGRAVYIMDSLELQVRRAVKEKPLPTPLPEDGVLEPIILKALYNYDPTFLGKRLCRAVAAAQKAIKDLKTMKDPFAIVLADACQTCYQLILAALKANLILGVCQHKTCGKPFFPARPEKKYCSREIERRNCKANAAAMNHTNRAKLARG